MTKSIFCPSQTRLVPTRRQQRDGSLVWHGRLPNAKLIRVGGVGSFLQYDKEQKTKGLDHCLSLRLDSSVNYFLIFEIRETFSGLNLVHSY